MAARTGVNSDHDGVVSTKLKYRFIVFSLFFLWYLVFFGIRNTDFGISILKYLGIGISYRPRTTIDLLNVWIKNSEVASLVYLKYQTKKDNRKKLKQKTIEQYRVPWTVHSLMGGESTVYGREILVCFMQYYWLSEASA